MEPTYPAVIALRIAGMDRMKFNDIVARGYYQCAPAAAPRSPRLFTAPDIVSLVALARLIESGVTPRHAGSLACEAAYVMRRNLNVQTVHYNRHADGNTSMWWNGAPQNSAPVLTSIVIDLVAITTFVKDELNRLDEGALQRHRVTAQKAAESGMEY